MSMDFSRTYAPPGVYIDEAESTLISVTGVAPSVVAIVGPANGYRTAVDQTTLSETAFTLSKKGIDITSVTVTKAVTGEVISPTNYVAAKVGSPTDQNYDSTFAATSGGAAPTQAVFVAYRYTDPDYFTPKTMTSFEDVKDHYGEPMNTKAPIPGETYAHIASPLSLAAMIAIRNGATELVLCAAQPAVGSTAEAISTSAVAMLNAAVTKVLPDQNVTVLVPLTHGILEADADVVLGDLHNAIALGSSEGMYRFGICGFEPTTAPSPLAPDALISAALSDTPHKRRIMMAYASPAGLQMYSGPANSTFIVGHSYLAAAYAGRMQAQPVQTALTRQTILGFSGIAGTPLSVSIKNRYSSSGVAVTEQDRTGRFVVRHGVTCDNSSVNTREASVVRGRDAMVRAVMEGTQNSGLIGQPVEENLLLSVKSNVQGILEGIVSDGVILGYAGLDVRQSPSDPSVVTVTFSYRPAYPLNYIAISFTIDLSAGAISVGTEAA